MAAVKPEHRTRPAEFSKLQEQSRAHGETNDCWVKAMAVVTGKPYAECHAAATKAGRKPGKGMYTYDARKALQALGFAIHPVSINDTIAKYDRKKTGSYVYKNITPHHVTLFPEAFNPAELYLMVTNNHVLAVKDNEVKDWTKGRMHHVRSLYVVRPL